MQKVEKRITRDADTDLGKFLRSEEQPKDPAALRDVLCDEKYSRDHFDSGDIKTHIEKMSGKEKCNVLRYITE